MIVVDASVVLEVLLRTPATQAVEQRLFADGQSLQAPHLIDLEVIQVLRRFSAARQIRPEHGPAALTRFSEFPIRRYPHGILLGRIWDLRHNLTAYDAAYVALAEALDVTLVTRDQRLATAAGHHARIELI